MDPLVSHPEGIRLRYDILPDLEVSVLNRLLICQSHPQDGPADLKLIDDLGQVTRVSIEAITSLEEDPATGHLHFTGQLVDGGTITGYVRPGPPDSTSVGQATLNF